MQNGAQTQTEKTISSVARGEGWSSTEYGFFSGAYGLINVFLLMLFFGGVILDKMGIRFTGMMSSGLMFMGALIKWYALSSDFGDAQLFGMDMQVALASLGFAIFGMGAEITGITASKVIVKWFAGKELALAMGLQVAMYWYSRGFGRKLAGSPLDGGCFLSGVVRSHFIMRGICFIHDLLCDGPQGRCFCRSCSHGKWRDRRRRLQAVRFETDIL